MKNDFIEKHSYLKWVALALLIISSGIHFYLSLQTAEESSQLSSSVTEEIIVTVEEMTNTAINHEEAHGVIRKLVGHFLWFSLIGIFGYLTFRLFFYKKYYLGLVLASITGFIIALISELCQKFSSGRSCEFKDMMIDTSGYLLSVIILFLIYCIIQKVQIERSKN